MNNKKPPKNKIDYLVDFLTKRGLVGDSGKEPEVVESVVLDSLKVVVEVRHGDITKESSEAIVNAANGNLNHIGGLARAIVSAGGDSIQEECDDYVKKNGRVNVGEVVVSKSGDLEKNNGIKFVIHAVGPIWGYKKEIGDIGEEEEDVLLRKTIENILGSAESRKCASLSMPAISTGIFGYPKKRCAFVMIETVLDFFKKNPESELKNVRFTNFDKKTVRVFQSEFRNKFSKKK